jgi:hypothetical protein
VSHNIKPWWVRHGRDAVIKTDAGAAAKTRCLLSGPVQPDRERFRFNISGPCVVSESALELLKSGKVTEAYVDGWYRVTYRTGIIGVDALTTRPQTIEESLQYFHGVELDAEPIPGRTDVPTGVTVGNKPSIKDQILAALTSAPEGLTARQVGEKVECGKQWVFSNLSYLMRTGKVQKLGTVYRAA